MKRGVLLFAIAMVSLPMWSQVSISKKQIKQIDQRLEQRRAEFNIPGIAVAIVRSDEVILSKGYGVKSVDTKEPVDENTLFAIASNTKAFTAAAIGMLVEEGKLNWDDKVKDHLPYFQLYDPYVTENITVRDLLCHRSGLATFSGDLIWYGSKYNRQEVIERAKYLEPVRGFREGYGYQNIMFIAAGEIVAKVSGMSWDDFIKERFFNPLGMSNSNTSVASFKPESNIAAPHNEENGVNHTIQWTNWDNIGGAGAINSSVADVSKWLQLHLNNGIFNSDTLFSKGTQKEMWTIHTPKMVSGWFETVAPSKTINGYGLGWDIFNYQGRQVITHGGGYDGMISQTIIVPEEDLAFVILTNNINYMPFAMTYELIDLLLNAKDKTDITDQILGFKKQEDEGKAQAEAAAEESRIKDTTPSLALEEYAGTYSGEMYGDCEVRVVGDQLVFQFEPTPLFRGTLRHWHYDTFQLNWGTEMMLPSGTCQFIIGTDGKVEEMRIVVENPDFDFTELEFFKR